jgi:hypothetical protein
LINGFITQTKAALSIKSSQKIKGDLLMSIHIQECLGCGTSVAGDFKLCPQCCSKSDVGRFAAEPIFAASLPRGGASSGALVTAYPEDPGLVVAFSILFLATMVGLGHLMLTGAHQLTHSLGLWVDYFC